MLVQIFVPTLGGNGMIGTGYPVAKERVLTARHVVFPADRDVTKPIQVCWYNQAKPLCEWLPDPEANPGRQITVAWDGGEVADVVVLDCPFPSGIDGFGKLSNAKPVTGQQWESAGFARAGKTKGDQRPSVSLSGTSYSMADTESFFELGVDHAPNNPSLWKGASGSPVFVGGQIIGVIVSSPENFNAERFAAMPTWKLLQNQKFMDAVNFLPDRLAKPMKFNFSGKTKYTFTTLLQESWGDLANLLQIPAHEQRRFRPGYEANGIWEWAEARKRLVELPSLLSDIGRNDLFELFVKNGREE